MKEITIMSIPTFIIEEHHEAFIAWNYGILKGLIPATGNKLFHVDEHSDMGAPRFNRSIHELNGDITEIMDFSYNELNIAGFILPSVYKNIFEKVYWIKQTHKNKVKKIINKYVRSYNKEGKYLLTSNLNELKSIPVDDDRKDFEYILCTEQFLDYQEDVVLDIDLDYFSCIEHPQYLGSLKIEISEDEFLSFKSNKYHPLRFYGIGKIEVKEANKKFYLLLNNYDEVYPSKLQVDTKSIESRIKSFISHLEDKNITPRLIDICRSRFSGFTPNDQWEIIESMLIENLKSIYTIDIMNIDQ
jgi:hypothetical protein